ncbi:excinuclease ABC subunit UvrB [Myxococcota bacterium]|nr:excinuclease ABC subunit UvrB [Myxococcota bacterium]
MTSFKLVSEWQPQGDQPQAIDALVRGVEAGERHQVLLGVTGSGKTFTMAHVIARTGRSALVLAHNKILAAQLYGEFKQLFPENAVEYFVSYYDYYQPEAYVPSSDTYIEKDSQINDRLDKLRHAATRSLLERRDVIIVSSVSCIYGLGSAEAYYGMLVQFEVGVDADLRRALRKLVDIQYQRNDHDFHRGTFRVRGDTLEVFPAHEDEKALRVEFFGDTVEAIREIDPLRGKVLRDLEKVAIYPASHYVTPEAQMKRAFRSIRDELDERLVALRAQGRLLEAQRLEQRTLFDLESLEEMGHCPGIENYSRHLTGRAEGEAPPTLLEYFPKDFLLFVDESHQSIPQVGAMYKGDRSRKQNLVDFGFRLPSALDNRPLRFDEFEGMVNQAIYVSATPARYELEKTGGVVVEQVIRPTGLVDPEVEVRPVSTQVDDLLEEVRVRAERGERVLVTTLTKRMAEDLTEYYGNLGVRVRYMHSDVETLQRIELVRDLRMGAYDVLVGINLLREGLDLPEVSLVAVLDADKEGYLRSESSLVQTIGRAARNVHGRAILYADRVTDSMARALAVTGDRRVRQLAYNAEHGITPETVRKRIDDLMASIYEADYVTVPVRAEVPEEVEELPLAELPRLLDRLGREMQRAAKELEFEKAAQIRDRIKKLQAWELEVRGAEALGG